MRQSSKQSNNLVVKVLKKETPGHMLWNAKMRFGKTLSALEVINR